MILFSDNFNFATKNFHALYSFLSKYNVKFEYDENYESLKKNFYEVDEIIGDSYSNRDLSKNERYKGFLLFDIYELELLQKSMSVNKWVEEMPSSPSEEEIWTFFTEFFREELELAVQCSKFWIDYWSTKLDFNSIQVGLFFSGGQIYNRAFCEVMKQKNIPAIAMEHYFTGNDFYFEPKYEALPNNSTIKNSRFFKKLSLLSQDISDFDSEKKLRIAKNKNVKQPSYSSVDASDYILVLMQVRNDYAIASKENQYKNSVKFFCELISSILEKTDKKIVIKSHPYENSKLKNGQKSSLEFMNDFIHNLTDENKERIDIYSDYSLESLIDSSTHVVTLNSQTGIEASSRCKPVVCFGSAFYGGKGFTYDYEDIDTYIQDINNIHFSVSNLLAYKNYKKSIFLHLIGTGENNKVERIFQTLGIKLTIKEEEKTKTIKIVESPKNTIKKINPKSIKNDESANAIKQDIPKSLRLVRKLYRDPKRFFLDTRIIKNIKQRL